MAAGGVGLGYALLDARLLSTPLALQPKPINERLAKHEDHFDSLGRDGCCTWCSRQSGSVLES
jgi:hypothetical protein